ncbi:hypothetical protein OIO90_004803 [Microbotryomycetes sp. JL221]|nr:hypothetical protein OIO90_004803 [Microbotryomycetes sp. JL221]
MPDEPSTPSELTAASTQSPTVLSGKSDSAPPPAPLAPATSTQVQNGQHALPPKDYVHPAAERRHVTALPPAYAPNSTVPRFIRTLAILVFVVGGSLSAASAWIFKSFVHPRLLLALQMKTRLLDTHKERYSRLTRDIAALATSRGFAIINGSAGPLAQYPGQSDVNEEHDNKQAIDVKPSQQTAEGEEARESELKSDQPCENSFAKPRMTAQVLEPIILKLSELSAELPRPGEATTLPDRQGTLLPLEDAADTSTSTALVSSLDKLCNYIETETHSATTSSYRPYGAPAVTVSSERKVLLEAVSTLKAEIRSVKGALLNRRNFVRGE